VSNPQAVNPRVIARSDHPLSRSKVSPNALRVLYRLHEAGFQAFLVGGCVRDILIGRQPKDFDVATNALPDEVRRLFRNCRLIGRRFRLAHIVYGQEIIEVATFRASGAPAQSEEPADRDDEELSLEEDGHEDDGGEAEGEEEGEAEGEEASDELGGDGAAGADVASADHALDERGRILRDNAYGSIDDDVWRRDFTANSLYYNIADFSVWDYCNGVEDIAARRLRLIGDPATRFREDPVRMLRAARFEAKLGFRLDAEGEAPIGALRQLLAGVPPARLFDEVNKLFLGGHGVASLRALRERELLGVLLPGVEDYLRKHPGGAVEQLLIKGLANTDARVAEGKPVTPVYLFALLLYGPVAAAIEALPPARWHELNAIMECCDRALRQAHQRVTIPRRIAFGVRDMYALQPRLEHPRGRRAARLLEQPRFRAAYDLFTLRASLGLASAAVAQWWTDLQSADETRREALLDHPPGDPAASARVDAAAQGPAGEGVGDGAAPKRRRRRRGGRGRRPAGEG
jgi:poly(A) polymerase